jgi:hypothetical protein
MAGPPEYLEVRDEFYKESQGAILVFDVGSRPSFEGLARWLEEARGCGAPRDMVVCVAGTKADAPAGLRRVGEQEAREWAAARGLGYFEVGDQRFGSAGDGSRRELLPHSYAHSHRSWLQGGRDKLPTPMAKTRLDPLTALDHLGGNSGVRPDRRFGDGPVCHAVCAGAGVLVQRAPGRGGMRGRRGGRRRGRAGSGHQLLGATARACLHAQRPWLAGRAGRRGPASLPSRPLPGQNSRLTRSLSLASKGEHGRHATSRLSKREGRVTEGRN